MHRAGTHAAGRRAPDKALGELSTEERRLLTLHPHWLGMLGPASAVMLLLVGTGVVLVSIPDSWPGWIRWLVFAVGMGVIALSPLRRAAAWVTSQFVVTDERVIHRWGWLVRRSIEIPVARIADVIYSQGPIQRAAGVGDVVIESAGGTGFIRLASVERAEEVHRAVYDLLEEARARSNGFAGRADGPLEKIERLGSLLERGLLTQEEFEAQKRRLLKKL